MAINPRGLIELAQRMYELYLDDCEMEIVERFSVLSRNDSLFVMGSLALIMAQGQTDVSVEKFLMRIWHNNALGSSC